MLNQVVAGFNLLDRYRNWRHVRKNPPTESAASRFVRLFENHGVHRNQIPRYFGHDFKLQDMQNDASLLPKLDEVVLDAACAHFAVRREWLDGAGSQVHPCHDFYKAPHDFASLIKILKENNPDGELVGVLIAPVESDPNAEALLILQESIGMVGEKAIYRYHLCNNWMFSYWRARAYLTACIAIAWRHNVFVHGTYASREVIDGLADGRTLLGWGGEGVWSFGLKRWDPEDMALRPDAFLYRVDSERNHFGNKAGLQLWLELEQQGLMNTGFDKDVRSLFQRELTRYGTKSQSMIS